MSVRIEPTWGEQLAAEFGKPYFRELTQFEVRVVILGQDPYHGPGQAHGLCFSVNDGIPFPPSLQNIFKEVEAETGAPVPQSGNLMRWARQGVFLLNTCLTVRQHQAFSHSGHGWETFTDAAIAALNRGRDHLVFMLWGAPAGRKAALINPTRHLILQSAHPSPLSAYRGFMGNGHFLKCNEYLIEHGQEPILW